MERTNVWAKRAHSRDTRDSGDMKSETSTLFIPPHVLSNAQQQSRGQSLIWLVLRFNPDFMQQCFCLFLFSATLLCQKALRMRLLFSQSSLANVSHYQDLDAVK